MQALRKPIHQRPRIQPRETGRSAGFALHEVFCALVVLGIGLPMMGMAPGALSRQRDLAILALLAVAAYPIFSSPLARQQVTLPTGWRRRWHWRGPPHWRAASR